jgi:hypothetical protein
MQSIKSWLFLSLSLGMLVLTGIRAWGMPFAGIGAGGKLAEAEAPRELDPGP